jgi:hypothetical protein
MPPIAEYPPRFIGLRDHLGRLELWHWTPQTGRRKIVGSPCPDCPSDVEVGDDPLAPGVWRLAEMVLRGEGGPALDLEQHGPRFVEEVLGSLPRDHAWALDGCEIRAWVEDRAKVRPIIGRRRYLATQAGLVQPVDESRLQGALGW